MKVRALSAAVAAGLLLMGCGGEEPEATPSPTVSEDASPAGSDVDRSRKFVARVTALGTGAAAFTWEGEQELILTRVGKQGMDVNLLSAGFALPEKVTSDPSLRFRWAFDLLNAYGDEPGTFTMSGEPEGQQGLRSSAFLIFMKVKDPSKDAVHDMEEVEFLKTFNVLTQPCMLDVGAGEKTGTLTCPELATKDGETAGLTVTWEQTGPDLPSD